MKNEEYLNDTLEKIIDEAAKLAAEEIGAEKLPGEDCVELSEKHNLKMQQIFNAEREKLQRRRRLRTMRIAACVVLVLTAGMIFLRVADVSAWKTRFLNFVQEFSQPNTDYNTNESGGIVYSDDNVILNYVPVGFEVENGLSSKGRIRLKFLENDKYFNLIIGDVDDNLNVDTETANAEKIIVGTCDAVYITNPIDNAISWSDDAFFYHITGNITKEELVKIAENVKVLKNK
ncbi:MAG: DUF4367 domain-containing protein [Clostridia bacterium]|nr:DUF4367 domain-containing protein [Clostridia bacterium]